MGSINGKVVVVTGASSGIGKATAQALAAAGAVVYATARRPERMSALAAEGIRTFALDVTDEVSMAAVVATVQAEHGAIDMLVNNAGHILSGALEEVGLDAVRDVFDVNVFGLLRLSQLVLPAMRERGSGRIVNVGSMGGLFTFPGAGAYHMTKHAVESLTDALRAEVRPFGIDVVLIQPAGVRTAFADTPTALIPAHGGPYTTFNERYNVVVRSMYGERTPGLVSAGDVARTIVKAATADRPRTRYKVGLTARLIPLTRRLLGDRGWDAAMARLISMAPQDTPATSAGAGTPTSGAGR